jgi:hypothetical protein
MKQFLILIHGFISTSAIFSGFFIVKTNGLNIPQSLLENTPFRSFIIPGLILTIIVGGTQLIAGIFQLRNNKYASEVSAVAGFGIMIWIYTQLSMILQFHWLQSLYFYLGIVILILVVLQIRATNIYVSQRKN